MLVGIAGNVMKQNAIYPPPEDPDMATDEESGRGERGTTGGWRPHSWERCTAAAAQARTKGPG